MNKKAVFCFLIPVIAFIGLFAPAVAQDLPGKRDSITSAILGEKRIIQVVLPRKAKPTDKFDVLYVLDGDWNTKIMSQVQQFLEDEGAMPPIIIVGVLNTDRNRDFLPTNVPDTKTSGGAAQFLGFLKNELIPYVNKTYPSNGVNTLFGHSFGGVLVTYALLNEPLLFKSYIAADPSYWWDKGVMRGQVKDKLPGLANLNTTFYISGREGFGMTDMGITAMDTVLKGITKAGLTWKITGYPDETHGSVRLKSMYDGLKFSYAGFGTKQIEFHPMRGIMLKDKPIKIWYFDDAAKVRYTIDGTEPLLTSAKMQKEITLNATAKVTAKLFTSGGRFDRVLTGDFKEGTYLPALTKAKGMKPGGLHYSYYEGEWDKLPDFAVLKPVKTGIADSTFNLDKLPRKDNFALVLEGDLEVKEDGYYIFALSSDDGSQFYLNNQLLLDNDGLHNNDPHKSYILPLQKGFYPIKVAYFQKDGGRNLTLQYITPGVNAPRPTLVPFALQYGKE
jgi:predicted alpha/beta superfamily hydrolase